MFLKVSLPLTYVVVNSPSDSTAFNIKPFETTRAPHPEDKLFLDLQSYQLPWRQFNKKGEIYEIDDVHTLYPAFRTTTKIRPKMLPSSGRIKLFNLTNLGGQIKYGPKTTELAFSGDRWKENQLRKWNSKDFETAENEYAARLTRLSTDIYDKVYKKFLSTRLLPLQSFMEWSKKQKDIIGFYDVKNLLPAAFHSHSNWHYQYDAPKGEDGSLLSHRYVHKAKSNPMDAVDEDDSADAIRVKVEQTCFGVVPYSAQPTKFNLRSATDITPVSCLFDYKSDVDEAREKMRHSDVDWRGRNSEGFNPPILDWQQAGFPSIAENSIKALYYRQPIHQQIMYSKGGFVDRALVSSGFFLRSLTEEGQNPSKWFKDISSPMDVGATMVFRQGSIIGSIRVVSAMSENALTYYSDYLDKDKKLGKKKSFESMGKAYEFKIARQFGAKNAAREFHFPRGDLPDDVKTLVRAKSGLTPSQLNWESIEYFPLHESAGNLLGFYRQPLIPQNGWDWKQPQTQKLVIIHPLIGYSAKGGWFNHFNAITKMTDDEWRSSGEITFGDSVIYPRLSYSADTIKYFSYPTDYRGRKTGLRWVESRPLDNVSPYLLPAGVEKEGMEIISEILDKGLLPNEHTFDTNGNPMQSPFGSQDFNRLSEFLSSITRPSELVEGPHKFAVSAIPMKSGKAVKITQDLSLNFTKDTFKREEAEAAGITNERYLNALEKYLDSLRLDSDWSRGKVEYSVVLYLSSDDLSLSIIIYCPSILMLAVYNGNPGDRLMPFNENYDLMGLFGGADQATLDYLFKSQSRPYLLNEPNRYSSQDNLHDVIRVKRNLPVNDLDTMPYPDAEHYLPNFIKETVFNDYSFSVIHIHSGMTVSDPVNTLPLEIKRNKVVVKRPFEYTSVFPVIGTKVDFPLSSNKVDYVEAVSGGRAKMQLDFSPFASYTLTPEPPEMFPTNVSQKIFKMMNTNSRTFKAQRQPQIQGRKAKDYTAFDSIVLPFQNINKETIELDFDNQNAGLSMFAKWLNVMEGEGSNPDDYQMPFTKSTNMDARGEGNRRSKYLPSNISNWSLGVPAEFIPETYSLTGMELGLFNWPLGLV
jgi:hypothetical protein